MTQNELDSIIDHTLAQADLFAHNEEIFNIYEGDLLTYVERDLAACFTKKAFDRIRPRIAPINVLQKIVDKLSQIYQETPVRVIDGGTEQDKELVGWYEKKMRVNQKMNIGNEFFNMFKNTLIQPFVDPKTKLPGLRSIPSHQFTVWSKDRVNPVNPTAVIICAGKYSYGGTAKRVFHIYTDDEFLIVDEDKNILREKMAELENPDGINPFGKIPFVYVNRSMNLLIPIPDTDVCKMTKIIPILISDLNYAVMYQAFSIIYGINVEDKNLEMNPSAFWSLKGDKTVDQKPEVGIIKPQVDITQVLSLIQAELVFWLETKGVKAGSIGTLDAQNFASGLSKIIDELDTVGHRKKQVEFFKTAEWQLWDLLLHYMHPYWVSKGMIDTRAMFTSTAYVETSFQEQVPLVRRSDLVASQKSEVEARFTSRRRAIKRLNPEMTEEQIDELLEEIDEERGVVVMEDEDGGSMAESEVQDSEDSEENGQA